MKTLNNVIAAIVQFFAAKFGSNVESTYADDTAFTTVPQHPPIRPQHQPVARIPAPQIDVIVAPAAAQRMTEQPSAKAPKKRWMCFWKKDGLDTISARLVVRPDGKAVKAVYLSQKGNILRAKVRRIDDHEVHIQRDNRGPVFSRLVVGSQHA